MTRRRPRLRRFVVADAQHVDLRPKLPGPQHLLVSPALGRARAVRFVESDRSPAAAKSVDFLDRALDSEPSLRERLRALLQPPLVGTGELSWHAPLFEFQREGVSALLVKESLLLADEMGLGKTIQTIAALRMLVQQGEVAEALVVCPAGLLAQWRAALRLWAPELAMTTVRGASSDRAWQWKTSSHVHLVSYETLRSDVTESMMSPPRRRIWDVVILDEAQKIKNPDADVTRACKRLRRRRSWALTGTPLENKVEDLVSIMEFLTPVHDGAPARPPPARELLARHHELQLRRRKRDVLGQLPPKTVVTVDLELTGAQLAAYQRAEAEGIVQLRALGPEIRITNVLELISRLKQICNVDPATGQSAKIDDLRDRIATIAAQGDRALVFSQFTNEEFGVGLIASRLSNFAPLAYTGAMATDERDRVIRRFMEDERHQLLVLSLRAGGQGLNLQEASYVVHFDRWWNPAVERQAEDRSHRMGQTVPVTVYAYRCVGTIEQRIDEVLQSKQRLFDAVVDEVTLDIESTLSGKELFGLFGLEAPQR